MKRVFSLLALGATLISLGSLHAQTFSNPVRIATNQDPVYVFVVDVNGDGLPDLLYGISGVNSIPGVMETKLAQPSGGYADGPATTLPSFVGGCRPMDFNKDGKQDLVCIYVIDACDSQVVTMVGNGDGTFQQPVYSGLMQSTCGMYNFVPSFYTPADLNSDSNTDLIIGDVFNDEYFVLLGDGNGHFNLAFRYPATIQYGGDVITADLNGDGKPDLFANVGPTVWLGNGDGTFTAGGNYGSYDSCTLYDMDADGHPDAVCAHQYTAGSVNFELDILHGNADGSFKTTPISSQPLEGFAAYLAPKAILDINGDGIADIVGTSSDGLSVMLGEGNLKFKAPVHYAAGNIGGTGSTSSQIVDLNNDGYKDIVSIGSGGIYVSYGRNNGTFAASPSFPVATVLGAMTVADFNGDGIPDIAATGDNSIELSLGNGDGMFQAPVALPNGRTSFAATTVGYAITHGDFRGIGRQDILAIGSPGTFQYYTYVLLNNGDGTFQTPKVVSSSLEYFSIADFNHDGRDDYFTTRYNPQAVEVGLSNGDGSFRLVSTPMPTATGTFPAVADFNNDGNLDLVYLSFDNAYVLKGNGNGTFNTSALVLPIPPYQGQNPVKLMTVATGDFDGDGNQDFAVLAEIGGYVPVPLLSTGIASAVYVFYGNGDGTFSAPVIAGGYTELYDTITPVKLSGSSASDMVLQFSSTQVSELIAPGPGTSIGVVLSQPGRLFSPEVIYLAGQTTATYVADMNRDGRPDLLISNSSLYQSGNYSTAGTNSATELLNLGPQVNSGVLASTTNLVSSSNSFVAGSSITFTATVDAASPSQITPTGSVRFADQTGVATIVPLVPSGNSSAKATLTTNAIGQGADTMGATYSGDGTFAASAAKVSLSITGLPDIMTLSVTPNPVSLSSTATVSIAVANPSGSSGAVPMGYVVLMDGSTVVAGPYSLSNGSDTFAQSFSATGSHTLTASYSGDLTHVANTASQAETVMLTPNMLYEADYTVTTAQVISGIVTVSGGTGNPTPTGTITLTAALTTGGGVNYTALPVSLSNGTATINIPAGTLGVGTYTLTLTYTPDASSNSIYLGTYIAGNRVVVTAAPPGFALTGNSLTIASGATTGNSTTITVTPIAGFTGNVMLTASIYSGPSGFQYLPTLSFGSTSLVTITGTSAGTATLTVNTTAPFSTSLALPAHRGVPWYASAGATLASVLLFGIRRRRDIWRAMFGMVVLLLALASGVLACGGGAGSGGRSGVTTNPGTTAGTYTVTVTGNSGATTATGRVTVFVQ